MFVALFDVSQELSLLNCLNLHYLHDSLASGVTLRVLTQGESAFVWGVHTRNGLHELASANASPIGSPIIGSPILSAPSSSVALSISPSPLTMGTSQKTKYITKNTKKSEVSLCTLSYLMA